MANKTKQNKNSLAKGLVTFSASELNFAQSDKITDQISLYNFSKAIILLCVKIVVFAFCQH